MKRVLYISYDGLTDPLGQSQILPYLLHLSKNGYQFTILSFEKRSRLQKERNVVQAIVDSANITWVPLLFTTKPPVLSKMYDRLQMQRAAAALYKKQKFDLVHCRSYVAAEVGLWLKEKFGVRMLFDMRGFWADEKVDNGQWDQNKWFYRRIYQHYKKKEEQFLLHADGIVSLTNAAKDHLLSTERYQHLRIDVIPCCADLQHFDYNKINSSDVETLKKRLSIPSKAKVVTYLGSVGGWYLTQEMFSFFKTLDMLHPDYVMLVLTKDDPEKVREEARSAGIPEKKLVVTYANRAQLPVFIALSSCSIFFIRNTFSKKASSPTKHAELMGMGIPVICNDIGDTGYIIQATNTGVLVNEFNTVSFEEVIRKLALLEKMDKAYIRRCAMTYFDLQQGAKQYLSLYKKILA